MALVGAHGIPVVALRAGDVDDDRLHDLGMATANLEAAVGSSPEAFRVGHDHAAIVGDALILAVAMRGFVIVDDPVAAAVVAAEYERQEPGASKAIS